MKLLHKHIWEDIDSREIREAREFCRFDETGFQGSSKHLYTFIYYAIYQKCVICGKQRIIERRAYCTKKGIGIAVETGG